MGLSLASKVINKYETCKEEEAIVRWLISGRREGDHLRVVSSGSSPAPRQVPVRLQVRHLQQVQRQVRSVKLMRLGCLTGHVTKKPRTRSYL